MGRILINLSNTNNKGIEFGLINIDTFIIRIKFGLMIIDTIRIFT